MLASAVVALALLGCSHAGPEVVPPAQATQALPDALWQHWVHSFEDDGPGFRAYRPKGFAFPPARGREGFRLESGGRYVRYAIARGDGNVETAGTWKRVGTDTLEVKTTGGDAERMRILSVTGELLKLRSDP
ncbi:MAG: hypothetical protein ABW221_22690 [Vicinamibacteria bacterium]